MYINLLEERIRTEDIVIEEAVILKNFAMATIEWYSIPLNVRNKIAKTLIGIIPEFDDDWYYCGLIIPKKDGILNFGNIIVYANEYEPDSDIFTEVGKYINGDDTYLWGNFTIVTANIYEQTEICSLFLPSVDMRCKK